MSIWSTPKNSLHIRSTGVPKDVLLSAYNLLNPSVPRAKVIRITPIDKVCLFLPLFHSFVFSAGFSAMRSATER